MSLHFSFGDGRPSGGGRERPDDERAFRILVIADFSGRQSRGVVEPLGGRVPVRVDLDALDDLPGRLGAAVRLAEQPSVEIPIRSVDDLHPDAIYDKAAVFARLRDLRTRVGDPRRFEAAAAEVRGWAAAPSMEIEAKPGGEATAESEFAAMLGGAIGKAPPKAHADLDALIRSMIAPYIVPDRDPRQDELIEAVEGAIAKEMRAVLHCPAWQGVESAWRSLQTLVTGLELDESLELFALDAGAGEVRAHASELEHELVTRPVQTSGGVPWAVIVHLHEHGEDDLPSLGILAAFAHRAGAPLLTGVVPVLAGVDGAEGFGGVVDHTRWGVPAEAYADLRDAPGAEAVCVCLPRVLARLPYGPRTDAVERFAFAEVESPPAHRTLLWSSGATLVALLLGRAFTEAGWSFEPAGAGSVEDLPVLPLDGGRGMYPCAEAWLSDRAAAALAERGITPLVSVQNRGEVRIAGIRSLAGGALACRWG
jgi:hypothetical protein